MQLEHELLERDDAIAAADRLVAEVTAGSPAALFVLGEAGLGKTSLLDHAVAQAAQAGLTTGPGCGHPMETHLPFGLLTQALDSAGGRGLLGVDQAAPAAAGGDRAGAFFRVLRWLQDHTDRPIVLALDDVHWADGDSLALLSFLCRRLSSLRLGIVATMRPWPGEAINVAADLAHEGNGVIRRLTPLSEDGAAALVEACLGRALPTAERQRAFELSAGNPLLLEQFAVALAHGELPQPSGTGTPRLGQGMLLARFAGLPPAGMRCVQAAAVLGTSFLPSIAAQVAGLEGPDVDAALDALGRSGLILQRPGMAADFLHPLFRQALYDDIAVPMRTRLHARAFTVLCAHGMEAQAAHHAVLAQLTGDAQAIEVLERAGQAARRAGAFATAATHLDAATAVAGAQASVGLLLAQADALLAGGQVARALAVYDVLLDRPDCAGAQRVQALWLRGRALVMTGSHHLAGVSFSEAADLAGPQQPDVAAHVLLDAAFSALVTLGARQARPAAERAVQLARALGGGTLTRAEATLGEVLILAGDPAGIAAIEGAAPWHASGRALSPESDPSAWGSVNSFAIGCVAVERLAEADRAFTELRLSAERASSPAAMAMLATGHGYGLMRMGRLPAALEAIQFALSLIDLAPLAEAFAAVGSAYILLYMGQLEESERWCRRVEAVAGPRDEWNALVFLWDARGHRALREGAIAQACELYDKLEDTLDRMGVAEPCFVPFGRHAMSAYLAAGRVSAAERVLAWLESTRMPCRFPRIAASTGRAQLAELAGDEQAALTHHVAALALHEEVDLPLDHAETLLAYGGFLRRSGRRTMARATFTQAARIAMQAGAGWLAALANDELRVAGGRQRPRQVGILTAQEERVARLAAAGATNAEVGRQLYISVSTVETHLEHIYAKLGIHSRFELIARAAEFGPEP